MLSPVRPPASSPSSRTGVQHMLTIAILSLILSFLYTFSFIYFEASRR